MTLIKHNIKKLNEINELLQHLSPELYVRPKEVLSNATIGQHIRHIIEFYVCLENGIDSGVVCYDDRKRDVLIETDIEYAESVIDSLIHFLGTLEGDKSILMKANFSTEIEDLITLKSSIYRELAYALDHGIHHLAFIKMALSEEKDILKHNSNLGVAPSTVKYRKECVQ